MLGSAADSPHQESFFDRTGGSALPVTRIVTGLLHYFGTSYQFLDVMRIILRWVGVCLSSGRGLDSLPVSSSPRLLLLQTPLPVHDDFYRPRPHYQHRHSPLQDVDDVVYMKNLDLALTSVHS